MFTDIADAFSDYKPVMFDYGIVDEINNTVTVQPLPLQSQMLQEHIDTIESKDKGAVITLIAHSQGCVAAGLLRNYTHLRQAILLAPPGGVSSVNIKERWGKRLGATLDDDGIMYVPRKDGSTTLIPHAFVESLYTINPLEEYDCLANHIPTTIVVAKEDEMLHPIDFSSLMSNPTIITIDADHNFNDKGRLGLISILKDIVQ